MAQLRSILLKDEVIKIIWYYTADIFALENILNSQNKLLQWKWQKKDNWVCEFSNWNRKFLAFNFV